MNPALKPVAFIAVVFLGVMAIAGISEYRSGHTNSKELVEWRKDLPAAISDAAKTHQSIFIDFTATWCGPCQKMKQTTFADANIKKAMDRYIPVQIDIDQQPKFAQQFQVESIPTFVILSETGEILNRRSGFTDSAQMLRWLDSK